MKRRSWLHVAGASLLPWIPTAPGAASLTPSTRTKLGISNTELVLGSTLALSGPMANAGQAMAAGIQAAIAEVNAKGGVHGRQLRLTVKDDAYDPERTLTQLEQLLDDNDGVFALLCCQGTANVAASIPLTEGAGVPLIGPATGATSLRRPEYRSVFHVRASYSDETVSLVQQMLNMGLRSIAIVHLDNAFGQEVANNAKRIMDSSRLDVAAQVALAVDASNLDEVIAQTLAARPSAVLLGTSGAATPPIVQRLKAHNPGLPLACLSVAMTSADISQLGDIAKGTLMTRIVPVAHKSSISISRSYQAAIRAHAPQMALDHRSLEGYINTRVIIAGLERSGRAVTRARLRDSLSHMGTLDLGGFKVAFQGTSPYIGSKYAELGIVGPNGSMVG